MRRLRRRPLLEVVDEGAPLASPDPSPLDRLAENDQARRLLTALEAVPSDCRELWNRVLRGLSYREISVEMGVPEGALRVRAHRCRKKAAEAMGSNADALSGAQGSRRV